MPEAHHSKVNFHGRKRKNKVDNMTLTCANYTKKIDFSLPNIHYILHFT